jgi:hypothetical protein
MRGKGYYVKYTIKIIDGMLLIINGGLGGDGGCLEYFVDDWGCLTSFLESYFL